MIFWDKEPKVLVQKNGSIFGTPFYSPPQMPVCIEAYRIVSGAG